MKENIQMALSKSSLSLPLSNSLLFKVLHVSFSPHWLLPSQSHLLAILSKFLSNNEYFSIFKHNWCSSRIHSFLHFLLLWHLENLPDFVVRTKKKMRQCPLLNIYLSLPTGEEVVPAKKTKTIISTAQISETRQTRIEKVFFSKVRVQAFQTVVAPTSFSSWALFLSFAEDWSPLWCQINCNSWDGHRWCHRATAAT